MMTTELRIQTIIAGIARISDPGSVRGDADLYREVGVNSTAALDLLLTLEEQFDVQISDEAFGDARTLRALTGLIDGLR